jgi:hypothetical protein
MGSEFEKSSEARANGISVMISRTLLAEIVASLRKRWPVAMYRIPEFIAISLVSG